MGVDEIGEFANELEAWAKENPERKTLVQWLLTRTESRRFEGTEGKFVIERTDITKFDIKKAVMRAMEGYNSDLPTSGWARGGPMWPRGDAYGDFWPRG